jgi:methylated-DNA-protein-cysteine methyltransferase related protein
LAKSVAFIRIRADVLGIVRDVPYGRVCTYAAIGQHLDVMARHVAYILATLKDEERLGLPWHRVVAESGATNNTKNGCGDQQRAALEAEGVLISPKGIVSDLAAVLWSPESM